MVTSMQTNELPPFSIHLRGTGPASFASTVPLGDQGLAGLKVDG